MRTWLRTRRERLERRRRQRQCFHHRTSYDTAGIGEITATEASYVEAVAHVDGGRRMFLCVERRGGCGKMWLL